MARDEHETEALGGRGHVDAVEGRPPPERLAVGAQRDVAPGRG
ncbi:MAG TPA: hypothetical protein RMH99_10415 [Sandaracinaceae bacterium LLY-WYZ-13_1]|nr:hypothetical protein [Sandaracinaceae bacterium LLY-WYZ-13_1]